MMSFDMIGSVCVLAFQSVSQCVMVGTARFPSCSAFRLVVVMQLDLSRDVTRRHSKV